MATNFHSNLTNNQIHNPKDFSVAQTSSVMSKDINGGVDWEASPFDLSVDVTCGQDVAGNLHNRYFLICSITIHIVYFYDFMTLISIYSEYFY